MKLDVYRKKNPLGMFELIRRIMARETGKLKLFQIYKMKLVKDIQEK